jgi:hypothetical protein
MLDLSIYIKKDNFKTLRGDNIKNIYIIEGVEYCISQLSEKHLEYINKISERERYNNFRNKIIENEGDNICCVIKIEFPNQQMRAFDEFGIELIY